MLANEKENWILNAALPPNYSPKIPWRFPDTYCLSLTKTNNYSLIWWHILELQHMQYLQLLPWKISKKNLCPFVNIDTCPPFLVYALYITNMYACVGIFHQFINNLSSIPTWANIFLNFIWENNVTRKTDIPGNHKYQGLLSRSTKINMIQRLKKLRYLTHLKQILTKKFPMYLNKIYR